MTEACGFVAFCGRPHRHHGQHGGWRTRVVAEYPVFRFHDERVRLGSELTPRDLDIVAEYLIHGSYADAAECLGIAERTAINHGSRVMTRTGAVSIGSVAYALGWVTLPPGVGHD